MDKMVNDILKRIKSMLCFKTDIELSSFLNVTPQSISKWKKRESLDYELLINKLPDDIDLNYIFRGKSIMSPKIENNDHEVKLLREIIKSKEDEIKKQEIQKEVLQETIMKMTFYGQDDEEEMPVKKVAENSPEYK